jgi:phage tail sheath protein FI
MAELTFPVSPGVVTREIDLTGPTQIAPTGVPAGVVGTAVRGPAFVPVTVATFQDFIAAFGNSDGEKFGPIAMREWLRNAGAGTFVRVLGAGDGNPRTTAGTNAGNVTNAGFVVGNQLPQANGNLGPNAKAGVTTTNPGLLGKTHFLTAFMSESAGSTIFSDAGIQTVGENKAQPIIRGILMAPSGVVLALSSNLEANNVAESVNAAAGTFGAGNDGGAPIGTINTSTQEFVMLVNGLVPTARYKNILTASLDPAAPNYFVNVFNTDPTKVEDAGHYLYAHYDISANLAVVTGSTVVTAAEWADGEPAALLLTSSQGRNTGTATTATTIGAPNFENFEDRFAAAFSPFVVSQKFGANNINLFRFHTLSDGVIGSGEFKITIENVKASSKANNKFGTFDVLVRRFLDNDLNPEVVESFRGCTLDPTSDSYIAKRVGDRNTFFDFDAATGAQKVVVEGDYPNVSNYVRVELSSELENGTVDATALPTGFRGLYHLVTSGTSNTASVLTGSFSSAGSATTAGITEATLAQVVQPPVPMRDTIAVGVTPRKNVQQAFTWGVQFENKDSLTQPNKNENIDASLLSHAKFFPGFFTSIQNPWVGDNAGAADVGGSVLDADRFNNNLFTLERVQVITSSNDRPDPQQWAAATYSRNAVLTASLPDRDGVASDKVRFLDATKDFTHVPSQRYFKFTFPLIGGFDGVNIFDLQKSKLSDTAARREMDDTNQGGKNGPTVAAYRKAVDLMEAKQDVDIQLLAIPGIRHPAITDYAIEATERRFDALYIMDIEEKDEVDSFVTGSSQVPSVTNTVNTFAGRALDTSFAAAYYPDVVVADPATRTNVTAPPSAVVLGAFALNDAVAFPWFAPAGFTRGSLPSVVYPGVELLQQNRDDLYTADINPIVGDVQSNSGVTVFGQKTLLAAQSALDRVNVRRLLIDVRRKVRDVARTFLFEPNRATTIAAFQARVQPILTAIQSQGGLDRFRVIIDTTTTTQADIENNTIRGRIFLQPTRSVEFVSLDFVVSNNI